MSIQKRIGKVFMTPELLFGCDEAELKVVFSNFYPIQAKRENTALGVVIEYIGFSPFFDEVDDSDEVPQYDLLFERAESGETSIKGATKWQQ